MSESVDAVWAMLSEVQRDRQVGQTFERPLEQDDQAAAPVVEVGLDGVVRRAALFDWSNFDEDYFS